MTGVADFNVKASLAPANLQIESRRKVIFIRDAESVENVRIQNLFDCVHQLGDLRLPSKDQFRNSLSLLQMQRDAEVSELGTTLFFLC